MKVKIIKIELCEVEIPFKSTFSHALYHRNSSCSLFVKIHFDNGIVGYGEALPRDYVTQETCVLIAQQLKPVLETTLLGKRFSSFEEGITFFQDLQAVQGVGRCAVETAFFDALGKTYEQSINTLIGEPIHHYVFYSAIISGSSVQEVIEIANKCRFFGFQDIKVKVGLGDDIGRIRAVREIFGKGINLRVDANCAWTAQQAIDMIEQLHQYNISAVEQPVKRDDLEGLITVTKAVPEKIIADESLVTLQDAKMLAESRACDMFNIRISKCGGILNSLLLVDIARNHGIQYQLGCHAGESGVLSAVGRHFACCVKDVQFCEGSYGTHLLQEDITTEPVMFGHAGKASALSGVGVGVKINSELLTKYTVNQIAIAS